MMLTPRENWQKTSAELAENLLRPGTGAGTGGSPRIQLRQDDVRQEDRSRHVRVIQEERVEVRQEVRQGGRQEDRPQEQ